MAPRDGLSHEFQLISYELRRIERNLEILLHRRVESSHHLGSPGPGLSVTIFSRYLRYSFRGCCSAKRLNCFLSMNPMYQAISSRQAIFRPCRLSMVATYSLASNRRSGEPVSSQANPRPMTLTINSLRRRYSWFTSVISNSPRGEGFNPRQIGTTLES